MKLRTAVLSGIVLLLGAATARAQEPAAAGAASGNAELAVVEAMFTTRVESGRPADHATSFAPRSRVGYYLRVRNSGDERTITLVWIIDGHQFQTQTLNIGHSPAWRTWAYGHAAGAAGNTIEVQVKDEQGNVLHTDRVTIGEPSAEPVTATGSGPTAAAPAPAPAPAPTAPPAAP